MKQALQPVASATVGRVTDLARRLVEILLATYGAWRDDRCVRLGAGLAYYGLFAVVPVLTLAIALAALVFSRSEVQGFISEPLARLVGEDADAVAARVAEQLTTSDVAVELGPVGVASSLVASSLVFVALQDALNVIWRVPHEAGIRHSVRRRLLSFGVVLGAGLVVVGSLAAQTVIAVVGRLLPVTHRLVTGFTEVAIRLVPVAVAAIALGLVFALLPRASVDRRAAGVAGASTAVAMALGAVGVGLYVQRVGAGSAQQAAGSVLVILTAFYVESQILLAGAELTKVLTARWRASGGAPATPRG